MQQILPTTFALLQRTAAAGQSLGRTMGEGGEAVATGGPDLTWLMGMVAVLLAAIAAMAFGFRKVVMGSMQNRAAKRDMRILDVLPLGGKRQLAVVRCYDRTFALGLGEKSVELIAEMDHEAIEADRAQRDAVKGKGLSVPERALAFQERLKSAKERLLGAHDVIPAPGRVRSQNAVQQNSEALRQALSEAQGVAPAAPQRAVPPATPVTPAAPAASRVGEVSAFVPPAVPAAQASVLASQEAPAHPSTQPLGEVPARKGSNREFIA